jgi:hypothetical protein
MSIPALRQSVIACLLAAACASPPPAQEAAQPTSHYVITDAEIPTTGTESAYDFIQRVHPDYLRARPTQTYMGARSNEAPPPALFFNGQRIGLVEDLKTVAAPSLSYIRYYTIEEGKRKFGMQYGGGVIEIRYRTP